MAAPAEEAKEPTPGADFYGYLLDEKREPTKVLDGLLRAIAIYTVRCVPAPWLSWTRLRRAHRRLSITDAVVLLAKRDRR